MADNIHFPSVSFDWLGQLPGISEEARTLQARRATLADLSSGDADSLIKKGAQLLQAGDPDLGLKLLSEGRQRKSAEDRAALDKVMLEWWRQGGPAGLRTTPGTPGTETPPDIPPSVPGGGVPSGGGGGGGVPWPAPGGGNVLPPGSVPGRQSGLEALPGGPALAMSPSDQLIAAAQAGGVGGPAMGPRLAQAGGPLPAPASAPSWLQPGLAAQPMTTQPAGGTVTPPASPGNMRFNPQLTPQQREAATRLEQIKREMNSIPPGSRTGQYFTSLREDYKRQLDIVAPPKDWKDWYQYNYDQEAKGRPTLDYTDWKRQEQFAPEEAKAGLKIYTTAQDEVRKIGELEPVVNRLESLLNNPQFETGLLTGNLNKAKAMLRNAAAQAEKAGVTLPEGLKEGIDSYTNSVQLREAFTSLANSAVFAKLGSLGNQISEGDRGFIEAAFPSLRLTKEGNQLIIDYYKDLIARVKKVGDAANTAYKNSRGRLNPLDMNEAIDEAMKGANVIRGKDGELTPFGKRLQEIADKGSPDIAQAIRAGFAAMGGPATAPGAVPVTTAPPKITRDDEGKTLYRGNKPIGSIKNGVPVDLDGNPLK